VSPTPDVDARASAILDRSSEAYFEFDSHGLVVDWNYQAEKLFALLRMEVLGQSLASLVIPPRNGGLFQDTMRRLFDSEDPEERLEITALCGTGKELQVELTFFPIHWGRTRHIGAFAHRLDVQQQSDADAEKLHRDLMDQLAEPYLEVDLRGRFLFVNKAYSEIYEVATSDRIGESYKNTIDPGGLAFIKKAYQNVYRTGMPQKVEYPITTRGEIETYVEMSVALRKNTRGEPIGFLCFIRDHSARKRFEDGMAIARDAAEAASKAKSEFLANMSHEIRTPLNGVIGMLELARDTELNPDQSDLIGTASASAQGLLGLINDILDFSKIEARKLEFDSIEFDLLEVVAQATRSLAIAAQAKRLQLTCGIAPDVPSHLLGDPMRLRQVLVNLLSNAIKFTPAGEVALRVAIDLPGTDAQLRFSVVDTGIGIKPEKQKLIFEAFAQADSTTTRMFGGTGLGLTICSRIVQLMGGRIWVESEAGKGSTFHFTTRFEIPQHTKESARALETDRPSLDGLVRSTRRVAASRILNILLAEDNLVNQKVATRVLERLGHRVVVVSNGLGALAALETESFDAIFMDVQMPEMDGFAATTAIRAKEKVTNTRIPIIALTAHAMTGHKELCLKAGMDGYLVKPIDFGLLEETLEKMVELSEDSTIPSASL